MSQRANKANFRPCASKKYIAFFKPYAVLSQFSPQAESQKDTLASFSFPKDVYPLGRLDFDSEGLLLLSDDGRLNKVLLDPEMAHRRTYLVQTERVPSEEALKKLREGVCIENRISKPAMVELLPAEPELPARAAPIRFRKSVPTAWLELSICEGRNRQVRRMTASVGFPTLRLVRVAIGSLSLFKLGLEPGKWKYLQLDELMLCFK